MKTLELCYPGGVNVRAEVISQWNDGDTRRKYRKIRIVSIDFSPFSKLTPVQRVPREATVGREYLEVYLPADRYDSARWVRVHARDLT